MFGDGLDFFGKDDVELFAKMIEGMRIVKIMTKITKILNFKPRVFWRENFPLLNFDC